MAASTVGGSRGAPAKAILVVAMLAAGVGLTLALRAAPARGGQMDPPQIAALLLPFFGSGPLAVDTVGPTPLLGPTSLLVRGHRVGPPAKEGDDTGSFEATVDSVDGSVRSVLATKPPIRALPGISASQFAKTAEGFARQHFLRWVGTTRLMSETHREKGLHTFVWRNVLASGAETGDWCSVIIDTRRGGIVAFCQQLAGGRPDETSVAISAAQADAVACTAAAASAADGARTSVLGRRLVLAFDAAPGCGPAWLVTVGVAMPDPRISTEPRCVIVDARTGRVLQTVH